jgi:NTE family protein
MMAAHDRLYIEESDFDRTIAIDTLGLDTTEFDRLEEQAIELFNSGRTAAEEFLAEYQTQGSIARRTVVPRTQ